MHNSSEYRHDDLKQQTIHERGKALLNHAMYNKGPAFTQAERRALGLEGLLPPRSVSFEQQVKLAYETLRRKPDALEKYIGLCAIQDRSLALFYRLLLDHLEELMPIVYTPTVGLACQRYSHIFRRPQGLWITPDQVDRIDTLLANAAQRDVRLIVVTDNERILGLGDLGAGGIGIPIGKLALYTVAAGIHPQQTLAISLDVGTDNADLLNDDLYLGWPHKRLRGPQYDAFIEQFVRAVNHQFPNVLLQWEDFKKANAFRLLDRYRRRIPSFNDDIQGTASVGVASVVASMRLTKTPPAGQRILMVGAGAAGVGIARQLRNLLQREGLGGDDLHRAILMTDSSGFLHDGRSIDEATKQPFAWHKRQVEACGLPLDDPNDLTKIVTAYKPTVMIGTSGQPNIFSESVIRAMAQHVERPVVLPFSNPNSKCEANPVDVINWTQGRAIIATGSPFTPVEYEGRTFHIGQANNVYVFPGVGLGALVGEVAEVTDEMFTVAAQTLADHVSEEDLAAGSLFPPLTALRRISAAIAAAVIRVAKAQGVGRPIPDQEIAAVVDAAMWLPEYPDTDLADES